MPGPIVVAFDGTSAAEHALAWAAAAAVRRGSDLVVATTTWWPVMLEPVPTGVPLVPDACVDLAAERVTAQWPDLRVSGIESGGVGELLARAAELDASLLVLAADIRVPWRALTRGADRTLAFVGTVAGPVVLEVRCRQLCRDALALAFDLARVTGTGLRLLHTAWHRTRPADLTGFVVSELADWLVIYPNVAVTYQLTTAPRVRALKRSARTANVLLPAR